MPLVLLYTASACLNARDIWSRRHGSAFRVASGLCAILVLGWLWELGVDGERYWAQLLSVR